MSTTIQYEIQPQRRGGRVRGAEGYHKEDIVALLNCVRTIVPITTDEWDEVLEEYRNTHAIPNIRAQRDTISLKTKFKQLLRNHKPGLDSRSDVREAGLILDLIEAKMANGKSQQRRGGRVRGAEGFSLADSKALLSIVRRLLPVQRSSWDQVAKEYCKEYAEPNDRASRDGSSLKNKFRHWLKKDTANVAREEVTQALVIHEAITAKLKKMAYVVESAEHDVETMNVEAMIEKVEGTACVSSLTVEGPSSSDGGEEVSTLGTRRGGRALGSEGYSQTDTWALLACVREVLPTEQSTWEQVLQLYRTKHAVPNNRAQRNSTGVKIKFRQLLNYRENSSKPLPETVLEARVISKEIDARGRNRKHEHLDSGLDASLSHTSDELASNGSEDNRAGLSHDEQRSSKKRLDVDATVATSIGSLQQSLNESVKRQKHAMSVQSQDLDSESLRVEIASRELTLLRQREQREAELRVWEKERTMREKQRMDMETWVFVCDRLRTLHRERAIEQNLNIVDEINEEIAMLKIKKQQLASLMA
ncbi:uncharacterized protein PHALS_07793 [Plasmopara halstedii]|uniref:Uncharacterized protein n=1 Tax=Plasmopara halstedii TaxID=4781 RepID=A0A0P1B7A4_PLAHL|nr:uncharacterized protein PHALS_07793 [Plasmopara halstedii]CEG50065.1 hypothetical protein PHALS_07793 [Plasmopara halstedii]|eukprot:XP_024586434.1 hypothetical protein PHALS_07793 [Plasmopara halstedii]